MNSWWSWILFANGAFGLWLMGYRPKIGPWFNIAGQSVWFTYGVVTHQYGFLASATVYVLIFANMLRRAHRPTHPHASVAQRKSS